ncbi:MAG TPA: ABC transporter ATP-binding protein [Burkholderiaceae bacterium]|nr:ABC transporter ATP-binding protein [Burkholderiaceae bacterium]
MSARPPLLEIHDLHAGYGQSHVLHGMSLQAAQGEFITLLGRNGMGKSTTIKCLMGLMRPRAGTIRFDGRDITTSPSHQIARLGLGLVPEGRQIFPNLSVEENLLATARKPAGATPASNSRNPAAAPAAPGSAQPPSAQAFLPVWTLEKVYALFPRLQERRNNPGTRLSGGEQQMLAIGRALMTNPRLLILDEATEGLAPLVRRDIWNALEQLKRTGLTLLCIDKNLSAMLPLADRHYIVEKGRVAWEGSSADYLAQREALKSYLGI